MDLAVLLLPFGHMPESERHRLAWQVYEETYLNVQGKPIGVHDAHDGQRVIFHATTFKTAFYKVGDPKNHPKVKDALDITRIQRMKWIAPIIAGKVPNTHCFEVLMPGFPHPKRLYLQKDESYMIWLEPRQDPSRGEWRFSSAYLASPKHIMSKTQMGRIIFEVAS